MRARVAEIADGFFPGRCGPKEFGDIVNEIRGIAEERGRDPDTIEFGKGIYSEWTRTGSEGCGRSARPLNSTARVVTTLRHGEELCCRRTAEECAERLSAYLGSDAPHVLLELHGHLARHRRPQIAGRVAALVRRIG